MPYISDKDREDILFGIEQDVDEGLRLLHFAANDGDDMAMLILGDIYYNGNPLPADRSEAKKWYRLAADAGNEDAEDRLEEF